MHTVFILRTSNYTPLPTSVRLCITTHIIQTMHHYPCQSDSYQQEKES